MDDENSEDPEVMPQPAEEAPVAAEEAPVAAEEAPVAAEEPPEAVEQVEPFAPPPAPEPSRSSVVLRRILRWVLGVLVILSLGFLAATFVFYLPTSRTLSQTQRDVEQANQRIAEIEADLDAETERISALRSEKEVLDEELARANLHISILSALADVNAARLSLALDDPGSARLALTNTPDTLTDLADLVGDEQTELVAMMQSRLALALSGVEDDPFAAQSDLEVLANNLVKLENTYFVSR